MDENGPYLIEEKFPPNLEPEKIAEAVVRFLPLHDFFLCLPSLWFTDALLDAESDSVSEVVPK